MELRLFTGKPPEHTTREWYAQREHAAHLEEDWHRGRMILAAEFVNQASADYQLASVSDMGCGDGGMLTLLDPHLRTWGYDLQPTNVAAGRRDRGVDIQLADAVHDPVTWGEIAICTEMLEHLIDPHAFLTSSPARVVVASSPVGETEEHHYAFHTWVWDMDGYAAMFRGAGFEIVRHQVEGLFQVLMAVRP